MESAETQKTRRNVHEIRVALIRAAFRLGYDPDNGLVKQVLYRCGLLQPLHRIAKRSTCAMPPEMPCQDTVHCSVVHGIHCSRCAAMPVTAQSFCIHLLQAVSGGEAQGAFPEGRQAAGRGAAGGTPGATAELFTVLIGCQVA